MANLTLALQENLFVTLTPDYGNAGVGYGEGEFSGRINNIEPFVTFYGPLSTILNESVAVEYLFAESGYAFDSYGSAEYAGNQSNKVGPALSLSPSVPKSETFATLDSILKLFSLVKNETFTTSEAIKFNFSQFLLETLAIQYVIHSGAYASYEYGADELSFIGPLVSFQTQKPLSETFNTVNGIPTFMPGLNKSETFNTSENVKFAAIKVLLEVLAVENILRSGAYASYEYGADEINFIGPVLQFLINTPKSETFNTATAIKFTPFVVKNETFSITDVFTQLVSYIRSYAEVFAIEYLFAESGYAFDSYGSAEYAGNQSNKVGPTLALKSNIQKNETFATVDGIPRWNIFAAKSETFNVADVFTQLVSYIRSYAEVFAIEYLFAESGYAFDSYGSAEYAGNQSNKVGPTLALLPKLFKSETFHTVDSISKKANLSKAETFALTDFLNQAEIIFRIIFFEVDAREYFRIQLSDNQVKDLRKYATMISEGQMDIRQAFKLLFGDKK